MPIVVIEEKTCYYKKMVKVPRFLAEDIGKYLDNVLDRHSLGFIIKNRNFEGRIMSNHDGSYLLNAVINLLDEHKVFETIGKDNTQSLISEILKLKWDWDLNAGEILDGIGEKLGICYECGKYGDKLDYGVCMKCESR